MADTGYVIYFLWDPRNGDIRYIGQTANPRWRLKKHRLIDTSGTYCAHWKANMAASGVQCEMAILEKELTRECANERERWWIAHGRENHWPLTNGTDGGDGTTGCKHTLEAREKISEAVRERMRTSKAREQAGRAKRGHKLTLETRERIRQGALRQWARYRGEIS